MSVNKIVLFCRSVFSHVTVCNSIQSHNFYSKFLLLLAGWDYIRISIIIAPSQRVYPWLLCSWDYHSPVVH